MNIPESHKQTFHLMPFECHFLVALMTLAGQTDARTWARGSLPDVFIRFSQRPLGQAAMPLTLTCGCELAKWDGWDRHPLKQKSHSLCTHMSGQTRTSQPVTHTSPCHLSHAYPASTHTRSSADTALCPGQRIPNDFCFSSPSLLWLFFCSHVCADRPCHLTFISPSLCRSPEK